VVLTPAVLTRTLDAGTNVTLQASNDITLNSPLQVIPMGTPANLTLQAGRSIVLNASLDAGGGNLTLIANDSLANGVVDSQRDPGNSAIVMASGVTLNTGSGNLSIDLKKSTDKTNNGSGVVSLHGLTAGSAALSSASTLGSSIWGTTPGDGMTAGTFSQLHVTGLLSLNGASLSLTHAVNTPPGSTFTIVQTTGGVSGSFNGLNEGANITAPDGTTFTISYQGNSGTCVVLTQGGTPAIIATTTTLTVSPPNVGEGQFVKFTATVHPAQGDVDGGSVDFTDGQTDLGSAPVNGGVATLSRTLPAGMHGVTATYSGDTSFGGSTSAWSTSLSTRQSARRKRSPP
jgi:hypothetical protein